MPRKSSTPTVVDDPIVFCVLTHLVADGVVYRAGSRVRRSKIQPFSAAYWVADGSDELDISRARQAFSGSEPEPVPVAPPPRVKHVRSVKHFSTGHVSPEGIPGLRIIERGDLFDAADPFVRKHRDAFENVDE